MKKLLALILAGTFVFSAVGCQNKQESTGQSTEQESVVVTDSLEILNNVWESDTDDNKFAAMGGDYNQMTENAPGKFDVSDKESLGSLLVVPEDAAVMIDDAASLIHAMNANTFTSGAFHVTDEADVEKFAGSLKDAIINNKWICGAPETAVLFQIGDQYVVSVFGNAEMVEYFKTQLTAAYPTAEILAEESL